MNFQDFFTRIISDIQKRLGMLRRGNYDFLQHILDTYFSTRIGIAIIGILFPLILLIGGHILEVEPQGDIFGLKTLGSISAYYHTPMRDVFVGSLFAIGTSLYLYKGYTTAEDIVLDVAGICAVCIALLPTSCPAELKCDTFTAPFWHGVFAILFFILIAGICLAEALGKLPRSTQLRFFTIIYGVLGVAMIALPLLVWRFYRDTGILIFKLELAAVLVFSAYWFLKSIEIYVSQLEDKDKFLKMVIAQNSDHVTIPNP